MSVERHQLTSRVIPQMTLAAPGSLDHPPHLRRGIEAEALGTKPALERFEVKGNAIVSGGNGYLGMVACVALLQHGLSGLCIWDITDTEAQNVRIKALRTEFPHAKIMSLVVDVSDESQVDAAVEYAASSLGGPINAFVNFAGVVSSVPSLEQSLADFRRVLDVNATGSFLAARAVARRMVADGVKGGSIVLVASISGRQVNFPQPQVAYNMSKAAVVMLARSLAAEFAVHGLRVNSISPGYMNTILNQGDSLEELKKIWLQRSPMGRLGEPDELSGVVVLLTSRAGSYINGADIVVDGGQTLLC